MVMRCRSGIHRSGKKVQWGPRFCEAVLRAALRPGHKLAGEGAVAIAEEIESTWRPNFGFASR